MYRNRDFRLVTISIDEPDARATALRLLKERHVAAANYLSTLNRDQLADILDKDWEGPLPLTLLIAPGGKILYRRQGEIDPLEVRRAIVEVLGRTYASRAK